MNEEAPNCLTKLITKSKQTVKTRNSIYQVATVEKIISSIFFFPSTLNDWFNLNDNISNSESISIFKSKLLCFSRPLQSNYNVFDPKGL